MTVQWQLPTAPTISSYPPGVFANKARVGLAGVEGVRAKSRLHQTAVVDPQTGETVLFQAQSPTNTIANSHQVLPLAPNHRLPVLPPLDTPQSGRVHPVVPVVALPGVSTTSPLAVPEVVLSPAATMAQTALEKAMVKRQLDSIVNSKDSQKKSPWKPILRMSLLGVMCIALVLMASLVVPELYYRAFPEKVEQVATVSPTALAELSQPREPQVTQVQDPEPAFDPTLPEGSWIMIPSIGVETQLRDTVDPNEALNQGAWLVPDFGRPNDADLPIIAAAHRFGWDWWWQSDFGRKNSFYSLPNLKSGDTVEIVFNQRKYVYRVYSEVIEGTEITDYQADLILYTCKFLNSPERYFVYAKRDTTAEISEASQSLSSLGNH